LRCRCPEIPPVLPAAFVFQISAAAARKKAGGMSPVVVCWEARGKPGARGGQSD